jgi:hypothetical protein
VSTQTVPCPLSDQHCAAIDSIIETAPQVLAILDDCEDCEIKIPGARESLQKSLDIAIKLKGKIAKWKAASSSGV